jgi:hypothetical protein
MCQWHRLYANGPVVRQISFRERIAPNVYFRSSGPSEITSTGKGIILQIARNLSAEDIPVLLPRTHQSGAGLQTGKEKLTGGMIKSSPHMPHNIAGHNTNR